MFYTSDHVGSTRELISTTGAITSRLSYDVYGRTTIVSGTTLPTFQYANYYNHSTSGLYLTKYRAYDLNTGRWLSRDPIAEQGGSTLYDYVENDPIDLVDPNGLKKCYRWLLVTFHKNKTGNHMNALTTNDAAVGNLHYKANGTRHPDTTGVTGQAYPNGTVFIVNRPPSASHPNGSPDRRTVNDSGKGSAEPRSDMGLPMGVPPDGWIDLYTDSTHTAKTKNPEWDLTETDVGDTCQCPSGWSETPPASHP